MHSVDANGAHIPSIGLGTWTLRGDQCADLVQAAIETGYRHIDTAAMYKNEDDVGRGIARAGVPRDELFVTTKVWPTDLAAADFRRSAEQSLDRLGLEQVDLLLIHWPNPAIRLSETIGALEAALKDGLTRNIGVSNFPTALLADAMSLAGHSLSANQVEYHPKLDQSKVLAACRAAGMAMVSYCPLGRGLDILHEPAVAEAAAKHGRTPGQIVLRWHVQQPGVIAIPRTTRRERLAENLDVFGFELTEAEMHAISALQAANNRICDFEFSPVWDG
ncbi:aldo/keto reductase [Mesorhizobium sp. Z1-4]|uniref:aldo/keto reductase n=1 Tax=Mesorhizobium sp. Z1-4 TaxID=2448478 RepID=UPI000FDC45FA|nr:aldo/keto reductase [Mesorhizobium sp. Z1-4]